MISNTDCRTEEGITVGLIDSLITISRVLAPILKKELPPSVREALSDLQSDEDLAFIMNRK